MTAVTCVSLSVAIYYFVLYFVALCSLHFGSGTSGICQSSCIRRRDADGFGV